MIVELLPAAGLTVVAAITPGPNNIIVMNAATQAGVRGAARVIAGVLAGSLLLLGLAWSGVMALLAAAPAAQAALTVFGVGYMLWMGAAMIVNAGKAPAAPGRGPPTTLGGTAVFQLINPKAWFLILGVTSMATGAQGSAAGGAPASGPILALMLAIVTLACLLIWACAGAALSRWNDVPAHHRRFDQVMGLLLVVTAAGLIVETLP